MTAGSDDDLDFVDSLTYYRRKLAEAVRERGDSIEFIESKMYGPDAIIGITTAQGIGITGELHYTE